MASALCHYKNVVRATAIKKTSLTRCGVLGRQTEPLLNCSFEWLRAGGKLPDLSFFTSSDLPLGNPTGQTQMLPKYKEGILNNLIHNFSSSSVSCPCNVVKQL